MFDDPDKLVSGLKHFRYSGHEVIVFHILDKAEVDLKIGEGDRLIDMESGEIFKCDPQLIQKEYAGRLLEWRSRIQKECLNNLIDYYFLDTNTPFDLGLLSFLQKRKLYY